MIGCKPSCVSPDPLSIGMVSQSYSIIAYNHPTYYQPVFTLSNHPINISSDLWDKTPTASDYPIKVMVELKGSVREFTFDVKIVYDALID